MFKESLALTLADLPQISFNYFDEIPSTNDTTLEWMRAGGKEYSLVIADSQSSGKGRQDRKWITRAGTALAFSLIFFPTHIEAKRLSLFSPLGAIAVAAALESNYGLHPQIKWPNDVLLNRKKVCGILSEAQWNNDNLAGLVLGIGVNVKKDSVLRSDPLRFPATSIEMETGMEIDRASLLKAILQNLFKWRPEIGSDKFRQYWLDHLAFRGEAVTVQSETDSPVSGILRAVAQDGNLEIELESGKIASFIMGDVHLRVRGE